ncbi:TetR/AcrR family transcriptional regulator [Ancylobacter sp. SL191]|uniref:TetR/AcrR family transcriptional regulator n=1 Tax=Ancylobacter sp. SL191 TaxID=2995166 RepID=UPI00226E8A03|nr:TetR/AcrR family transcriptional regulator [Ancylobacter sp. SL191]WAC25675.1 TetR/AcrR family transcriptional regulator [Ancylobacter sp. SL191]
MARSSRTTAQETTERGGATAPKAAKSAPKPRAAKAPLSTAAPETAGEPPRTEAPSRDASREKILDNFLVLLAERPFERISLGDVAQEAGVSLSDLRAGYGSTFDMVSAFVRDTDRKVLAVPTDDMADEPPRDRLFDVLMRRFDVLGPHKAALRSLADSARRNPFFALALNRLAVRSQQWMLAAAKIDTAGLRGAVRAQGLALIYARVLQTYLRDEDPALARTMAALDRELDKGQRALDLLEGAVRLATGGRRRQKDQAPPEEPVTA